MSSRTENHQWERAHFHQLIRAFSEGAWRTEPNKKGRKRGGIRRLRKSGMERAGSTRCGGAEGECTHNVARGTIFLGTTGDHHRDAETQRGTEESFENQPLCSSVSLRLCGDRSLFPTLSSRHWRRLRRIRHHRRRAAVRGREEPTSWVGA